jgi:signal transduction histidine kinase
MRDEWREYAGRILYYLRFLPLGVAAGFIPFALSFDAFRAKGQIAYGLSLSLSYGVVVSLSVFAHFAAVYAALCAFAPRVRWNRPTSLALHVAVAALGTAVGVRLTLFLRGRLGGEDMRGAFMPSLVFGMLLVVLFALYLAYRQAREDALALRAAAAEARYDALEQQMRPHFLFNALNSLAELIETDRESAVEVTQTLADLYRQILANSKAKTSTLASELDIARCYLEIERLRFGPRLAFEVRAEEGLAGLHVPSLVVQTLVENAVKHGVSGALEGGEVEVRASRVPDGLYRLSVANTGKPWPPSAVDGTGLSNTRARLDMLYGDRHRFAVGPDGAGRTVASFYFTGEAIG